MDEGRFWALIGEMQGDTTDSGCHRLYLALRRLELGEILDFHDRLAEVLHRLDLRSIAKQRWKDSEQPRWLPRLPFISADGFLYARCAAVVAGRETVTGILEDHRKFRGTWDLGAEQILYVAEEAYRGSSGREWPEDHEEPFSYETGSNELDGWNREGVPPGNPQ